MSYETSNFHSTKINKRGRSNKTQIGSTIKTNNTQTGILLKWKVTSEKLREAYTHTHNWSDEERVKWFGKDMDFFNNGGASGHKIGARYRNFGRFYGKTKQNYQSKWDSLPDDLKEIISVEDMGSYIDDEFREYKPRTMDPDHMEYGLYEFRLPKKYYKPNRMVWEDGFPRDGEILHLKGKGREIVCSVAGGAFGMDHHSKNSRPSTGLVRLDIFINTLDLDI